MSLEDPPEESLSNFRARFELQQFGNNRIVVDRDAIRIELALDDGGIGGGLGEQVGDDGVIGIGLFENGVGGEVAEARVCRECEIGGGTVREGREGAELVEVASVVGSAVVSAEKKVEETPLMSHCCEERRD